MKGISLFDCTVDERGRAAVDAALQSGVLVSGPAIRQFELAIEERFPGRSVVAMSDSTHALVMALQLSGVQQGDEVLVLSFNCLSSTAAITLIGASPVWVDIDPETAVIDVVDCAKAITERTRALVVYHVAGYPGRLNDIRQLCDGARIAFIEDANNAFGAVFGGQPVGTFSDFAVISFYANRQVNAVEGAALICRNAEDGERSRRLRRYGIDINCFRDTNGEINDRADIVEIGMSAPMLNTNATLGVYHLQSLNERLAAVRRNVAYLERKIDGVEGLNAVTPIANAEPAYWVWLLRCRFRDQLLRDLWSVGIRCSKLHRPNHFYAGFSQPRRSLSGTLELYQNIVAIPCGWWLQQTDLDQVIQALWNSAAANGDGR